MPLHFSISHPHRLVIAIAKGSIVAEEVIAFMARIDAEKAQSYRKMFDISELETVFADGRIERLADIVRDRAGPAGPIAVVARQNHALRQARLFAGAASAARLVKVFKEQHLARRWLDEVEGSIDQ